MMVMMVTAARLRSRGVQQVRVFADGNNAFACTKREKLLECDSKLLGRDQYMMEQRRANSMIVLQLPEGGS